MGAVSLIEPLEINDLLLPNKFVFPAILTNFAARDGFVTERLHRMYDNIARGGSRLITTGAISVSYDGVPNTNVLKIGRDSHIESFKTLFKIIKQNGAVLAAQLIHAGRQAFSLFTGHPLVAPSAIPCPAMKEMQLELDDSGIKRIQDDFALGASRAKKAGAELTELNGAFGYFIGGFLSPFSNKRTDRYGSDKTLFFAEILEKVKHTIGNIPVSCRISADDFVEGGLNLYADRKIARRLVDAWAGVISVAAGTYASMNHMPPSIDMDEGVDVNLPGAIHDGIDVPVIYCGNIRSLNCANNIVFKNKADLVAAGRPQIADPYFVKKLRDKQPLTQCNDCGACLYYATGAESMSCPNNPEL